MRPRLPCRKANTRKIRLENKCNKMISDKIEKNRGNDKTPKKKAIKRIRTKLDTKIKSNKILRDKIKKNLKFKNIKNKINSNQTK